MSLVERALKKLQESRGTVPAESASAATDELPAFSPSAAQAPSASRPAPAPVIEPAPPPPPRRTVAIDRTALRTMQLLPPLDSERLISSQYQQVKRPLVAAALGKSSTPIPNGHLIMLASALAGEGKTFTSINLALSMALEKDIKVLLVDADVAKPHVSRIFDVQSEPGLLDLLVDSSLHAESLILPTDIPGLSILPTGRQIDTATELLASKRMEQVVAQLGAGGGRRIVLFDSPPLLLSTESRAILPVVGQVVLVVRAEVTSQQAVLDALELVGDAKPVRLILNQSKVYSGSGYYGYGYGEHSSGNAS
jgi:protein-tyrosine kinase